MRYSPSSESLGVIERYIQNALILETLSLLPMLAKNIIRLWRVGYQLGLGLWLAIEANRESHENRQVGQMKRSTWFTG
ncbi:MAG: hypothetical protein ACKOA0_03355 [Burkholderiaceae bacterium]